MSEEQETKKFLLEVEAELYQRLKVKAVSNKKTLKEVLNDLIKQYVKEK